MIGAGRAGDSDGSEIGRSSLGHCAFGVGNVGNGRSDGLNHRKRPEQTVHRGCVIQGTGENVVILHNQIGQHLRPDAAIINIDGSK
ncbi:hypothetical protein D3C84_549200 [compost metagenome]